jgi:hypothetical protein
MRLERIIAFFELAPPGLVNSIYCDVPFARYFGNDHDPNLRVHSVRYKRHGDMPWLYAYNASSRLDVARGILKSGPGGGDHAGAGVHDEPVPTSEELAAARAALPELNKQFVGSRYTVESLAEKLARDRRTFMVTACTRLWLMSTAPLRTSVPGAPPLGPAERAAALAQLWFKDSFVIWKAHGLHFQEKALNLAVYNLCLGPAFRQVLHTLYLPCTFPVPSLYLPCAFLVPSLYLPAGAAHPAVCRRRAARGRVGGAVCAAEGCGGAGARLRFT